MLVDELNYAAVYAVDVFNVFYDALFFPLIQSGVGVLRRNERVGAVVTEFGESLRITFL